MNSMDLEHDADELRDVVLDVILAGGGNGLTSFDRLLEKTALELGKRDALTGRKQLSSAGVPWMKSAESEQVVAIAWDFARRGVVTFGRETSNPAWPNLRRSRFGEHAIRRDCHRFPDSGEFLRTFRLETADISPDAAVYLREALAAFYMDCLLSACVTLSIAAEYEFLKLLRTAKNSATHAGYFSRIGDDLHITAKISQFKEAIRPILDLLPKPATNELDHNLDTVQSVIRLVRNETGKPSSALPPSRDQVYLYLLLFIPFARQATRLRRELNERSSSRLVRLH
jgi:hypothetical protein